MRRYTPVPDGTDSNGHGGAHGQVLRRLVRDVDQLGHHVATALGDLARVRGDVEAHTRALTDLAQALRASAGGPDTAPPGHQSSPGLGESTGDSEHLRDEPAPEHAAASVAAEDEVPEWLTVTDPATAIRWLSELDAWVHHVWSRYTRLPPCWAWHPVAVAELLTCHQTWIEATTAGAGAAPLAAWHDRWRPGTAHRVAKEMSACERTGGGHAGPTGRYFSVDPTVLDELALWWATTHASESAPPPPGLTPEA